MSNIDWHNHIEKFSAETRFRPPTSEKSLSASEAALGLRFPESLRSLLLQSDGVFDEYGTSFIWPVQDIREQNLEFRQNHSFRQLYMPFDHLLFFGDAGNSDHFAFPILAGEIRKDDVFGWNHEDDSRSWLAPSLEIFIEWWLINKVTL